jgi:hypothetical protein
MAATGFDDAWEQTTWAMHHAEEGDTVIWEGRESPLTVVDVGGTTENENHYLVVRGPGGGTHTVRESYSPAGTPQFTTDNNESVENLRIVEREGADPDADADPQGPGGEDGVADDSDAGDGDGGMDDGPGQDMSHLQDDYPEFFDTEGEFDPEEDALEPDYDGSMAVDLEDEGVDTTDIDQEIQRATGDPFITYEEFLEDMYADSELVGERDPGSFLPYSQNLIGDDPKTWTFVDELTNWGITVPQTVNEWVMVDYGIVTDAEQRKLVWINSDTDELVALVAHRNGSLRYHCYYAEDWLSAEADDGALEADLVTSDPNEAFDSVRQKLYGGQTNVEVQVIERRDDDEVVVAKNIDNASIASRMLGAVGADIALPHLPGEQQLLGGLNTTLEWLESNEDRLADVAITTTYAGLHALGALIPFVDVAPVLDRDDGEVGLELNAGYNYKGDRAEWINVEGDAGAEFTIDTDRFDLRKDSMVDRAWEVGEMVGADDIRFQLTSGDGEVRMNSTSSGGSSSPFAESGGSLKEAAIERVEAGTRGPGVEEHSDEFYMALREAYSSVSTAQPEILPAEDLPREFEQKPDGRHQDMVEELLAAFVARRYWENGVRSSDDDAWNIDRTESFAGNKWDNNRGTGLADAWQAKHRGTPSFPNDFDIPGIQGMAQNVIDRMDESGSDDEEDGDGDDGDGGDVEQEQAEMPDGVGDDEEDGDGDGDGGGMMPDDGDGDDDGSDDDGDDDDLDSPMAQQFIEGLTEEEEAVLGEGGRVDDTDDLNEMGVDAFQEFYGEEVEGGVPEGGDYANRDALR